MKHFIDALEQVVIAGNESNGDHYALHWHHKFDINKEGYLPQWSAIAKTPGVDVAIKELEWVLSQDSSLDILHDAGLNHRDYMAVEEDVMYLRNYTFDERVEKAKQRFFEAGVILEDTDALKSAFLDNGMMDKHLTLGGCMAAMGLPEAAEEVVVKKGEIGLSQGKAFQTPTSTGVILFHAPELLPEPTHSIAEAAGEGRYINTPKQIQMSFLQNEIPVDRRIEIMHSRGENQATKLITGIVNDLPYKDLVELGLDMSEEDYDLVDRGNVITDMLTTIHVPRFELHTRLMLSTLSPLKEYSTEVLPYMLYAEQVALKTNMINTSFTLDVDYLLLDKETLGMLIKIKESELDYTKVGKVQLQRPGNLSIVDVPLTKEEVKTFDYIGL
ncbi:hypothetical protein [Photobacterium phage PDCC-1]|uniref:Uncharacterized protein n=1 Tax=Photobacterium phage PDCC-1 TaxID=2664246 RepID=A0A6B9J4U5_9CAUD|nr:hypothetical protein HWC77_gp105 [Photobacterium phage PDCC-1]QGZ14468.1 hypothetical protein [Photobacterium phage PDCC-1]